LTDRLSAHTADCRQKNQAGVEAVPIVVPRRTTGTVLCRPTHPRQSRGSKPGKAFSSRKSGKPQNVGGCCNLDTIPNFAFRSNSCFLQRQRIVFGNDAPKQLTRLPVATIDRYLQSAGGGPRFSSILLPTHRWGVGAASLIALSRPRCVSIPLRSLTRHRGQCRIRCVSGNGFHPQCPDQQHPLRRIQGRLFQSPLCGP
jgi:hypothetical protein